MVQVKDIMREMEKLAPVNLKEDFDNVGLMVGDKEQQVNKVLLALDCTMEVIEEAKDNRVDLIITHHPLIFRKPSNITTDSLQGNKIIGLIKNDISLYSSHTNLDSAEGGLNATIVKLLGFKDGVIIEANKYHNEAGLGRVVELSNEITIEDLAEQIKAKLQVNNLRVVKSKDKISKVAIINGSGQDYINKAIKLGADCIITGDTTYHYASDCKEMGINIIDVGHFPTEWLVFLKVMEKIKCNFSNIEFIDSKVSRDPYQFF